MTGRPVPKRHWRSYGDDPLPTGQQALREPLREFDRGYPCSHDRGLI